MLSEICNASCSTLCIYAQQKQACTDVFRHCCEWNLLMCCWSTFLWCFWGDFIVCRDDSPLRRSAFKPLHNSCASPLYVKCSCWRLTAYILPVFTLMFKCHGFFRFRFVFVCFFWARHRSLPALSSKCPASVSLPRIPHLKKQHTVLNYLSFFPSYFHFFSCFYVYAWKTFRFFSVRMDGLNNNGLICAFATKVNFKCVSFWDISTMTD